MIRKFLTFLPLLLLPTLAMADDTPTFSPTDKVLYFNADVLKDVIKRTFPENLQLNVAQKYVDLMDEKGNMSVADLVAVCDAGGLDVIKCRNFIQDLLATSGNNDIKPFYWADYVGKGKVTMEKKISGDGYFGQSKYIGPGEWYIQFDWTQDNFHSHDKAFKLAYPDSNTIFGTSACTNEPGTPYVADNTKNFASNEQTGEHCWCKMTAPEETPWIYLEDEDEVKRELGIKKVATNGCARQCAGDCLYEIRGQRIYKDVKPTGAPWEKGEDLVFYHLDMQKAMFTAVKLNKSIANVGEEDDDIEKDLNKEFKPCEFDWGKITEKNIWNGGWWFAAEQHSASLRNRTTTKPFIRYIFRQDYSENGCNIESVRDKYGYRDVEISDMADYCKSNHIKNIQNEFIAHYGFMNKEDFQCKYPGAKYVRGVFACTNDYGRFEGDTTNKQYTPLESSGPFCWCKITSPEESKWVYLPMNFSDNFVQFDRDEFRKDPFNCVDYCMVECARNNEFIIKTMK